MASTIDIDQLASEIAESLSEYSKEVVEKVDISSERAAKETVKNLKATSPKKTGKYSKSWKKKTEKQPAQPNNHIIYNQEGWKTHLLENGHAKRGGGRVEGIPHIKPAEQQVIEEFTKEVEEAIRNG